MIYDLRFVPAVNIRRQEPTGVSCSRRREEAVANWLGCCPPPHAGGYGWLLGSLLTLFCGTALAHTPSETYFTLALAGTNLTARWDVALRDLHQGMGLPPDDASKVVRTELQQREEALSLDIAAGLKLQADDAPLQLSVTDYTTLPLNGVEYARLILQAGGLTNTPVFIEFNAAAVFRLDTNMHGLLRLEHDGRTEVVAFNGQRPAHRFDLSALGGRWARWLTFVGEGVWHIWIGFDHILFLVSLLLPAVLKRERDHWTVVEQFHPAFVNVLKIITAFTVAHSITLTLAALDIMRLPPRFVESVIAASVALAALNNLWPWVRGKSWMVAGGFGLIHGFGFANALADLGLSSGTLALALVGFNVGVELGQLAIVALFLPVAFGLRRSWFYQTLTFKFGSAVVVLVAVVWMTERAFDTTLMHLLNAGR